MSKTSIEWARNEDGSHGETWNPLGGCKEVSPECTNCYAAKMAHRLAAMGQRKYQGTTKKLANGKVIWTGKMNLDHGALSIPLKTKKPTTWFVNSMSDLFHEDAPDAFIDEVFGVMAMCPRHIFQVLTKRADRMEQYFAGYRKSGIMPCLPTRFRDMPDGGTLIAPLPNVWLGVSVGNKKSGLPRIEHLLQTPAAVRFLSIEPLLEDLGDLTHLVTFGKNSRLGMWFSAFGGPFSDSPGVDWVIVGGESGPGARPMHPDWVRSIRDQSVAAGVAFFFKQWGGFAPCDVDNCEAAEHRFMEFDGTDSTDWTIDRHSELTAHMVNVGKKKAGRLLDGREWNEMPERQVVTA